MAIYYYRGGLGTGADDGSSGANAFRTYAQAVTAANADGDIIKSHFTGQEEIAVDATYTYLAHISVIAVDFDSADALATMGTGGWIGNSTTNRTVNTAGAKKVFHKGITFRIAGGTVDSLQLGITDGAHQEFEDCYLWLGNTATGSVLSCGAGDTQSFIRLKGCTLRFGNAAQTLRVSANVVVEGGSVSSAGSAPTNFVAFLSADPGGCTISFEGFDASHLGSGNLVADATAATGIASFVSCKLGSGFVMLATQTLANKSGASVHLRDCAVGDTHLAFGYADPMGSVVDDTGIFFTSGDAQRSWKIVTTGNAGFGTPFVTPWIDLYHDGVSAITPFFEVLRDGSATAYQDDELWGEWSYKGTTGFAISSFVNDRMAPLGTPANQAAGAGTGSWTGEGGTAWSGKLAPASAITPAEIGYLRGRIVVGEPSITAYADPQIRT